jgi:hypothetical protein
LNAQLRGFVAGPYCRGSKCSSWLTPSAKEWSKVLCIEDGPVVGRKEIPAVHGVVVGSEVVAGKRNGGEVVVVDTCSLRAHNQWILIGEFIGTTSLGNSFFVQSSGLK